MDVTRVATLSEALEAVGVLAGARARAAATQSRRRQQESDPFTDG